jgi:hypothetical protein
MASGVLGVRLEDGAGVTEQIVCRGVQRGVLGFGAQEGQLASRDTGPPRGVVHLPAQGGDRRCLHTHRPSVSDMPE